MTEVSICRNPRCGKAEDVMVTVSREDLRAAVRAILPVSLGGRTDQGVIDRLTAAAYADAGPREGL